VDDEKLIIITNKCNCLVHIVARECPGNVRGGNVESKCPFPGVLVWSIKTRRRLTSCVTPMCDGRARCG